MTTGSQRETATIYTFPARGRFAPGADRDKTTRSGEQHAVETVTGSGWYHDEAIREERTPKNH
jgi:hypothetical protein